MVTFGKSLIFLGLGITLIGLILWGGSKLGLPLGKLPGDVRLEGKKISIYFPLITCLFLSVFLTIILNVIFWLFRK